MDLLTAIRKVVNPVARRVGNMVQRSTLNLIDDATRIQQLQVELRADQTRDNVEHFTNYGFTHHPHPGSEAIMLSPNGDTAKGIAIVVGDRRYRLKPLEQGEVALYDDQGQTIKLARDGIYINTAKSVNVDCNNAVVNSSTSVEVNCANANVNASGACELNTPTTTLTGNLNVQGSATVAGAIVGQGGLAVSGGSGASVTGAITASGDVTASGISLTGHTHPNGNNGSPTGTPT